QEGIAYRRASGIGLITFYASYPSTGSVSDEFVRMWRARVEPAIPGPVPQPQAQRDGDYTVALGKREVDVQGAITTVVFVAIVGRGRAIGVLITGAGDEVLREITAFSSSLTISQGAPAATAPAAGVSGAASSGGIEVDFDAPPGYVARQDGRMVVLTPA